MASSKENCKDSALVTVLTLAGRRQVASASFAVWKEPKVNVVACRMPRWIYFLITGGSRFAFRCATEKLLRVLGVRHINRFAAPMRRIGKVVGSFGVLRCRCNDQLLPQAVFRTEQKKNDRTGWRERRNLLMRI